MSENSATVDERSTAKRSLAPFIAQAALVAVGVYVSIESLRLGLFSSLGPGAGMFPFVVGLLLILLSTMWAFQEWRKPDTHGERAERGQVISVFVSLVLLAALMPLLGYQLSVVLFLVYQLRFRAGRPWWLAAVLSLAGSVGSYYAFTAGLGVPLPTSGIAALYLIGL